MKDTSLTYVVNDYDTFTTTPSAYELSTSNRYRILVNNLVAHGVSRTRIEHHLNFIENLEKAREKLKQFLRAIDQ